MKRKFLKPFFAVAVLSSLALASGCSESQLEHDPIKEAEASEVTHNFADVESVSDNKNSKLLTFRLGTSMEFSADGYSKDYLYFSGFISPERFVITTFDGHGHRSDELPYYIPTSEGFQFTFEDFKKVVFTVVETNYEESWIKLRMDVKEN